MKMGLLKENHTTLQLIQRVVDLLVLILAFYLAWFWRFGLETIIEDDYNKLLIISIILAVMSFTSSKLYRSWRGLSIITEMWHVIQVFSKVFVLIVVLFFFVKKGGDFSRQFMVAWFCVSLSLALFSRFCLRLVLRHYRSKGYNMRTALIIGHGEFAEYVQAKLSDSSWMGIRSLGIISHKNFKDKDYLGTKDDLYDFLDKEKPDQVWLALPTEELYKLKVLMATIEKFSVTIRLVPDMLEMSLINHHVSDVDGMAVVTLSATPMEGMNRLVKSVMDKVLSLIILVMVSPIMISVAILIKITSPGPILYRQERVSWSGRPFNMYKFRSMPVDNEKSGVKWGTSASKEVTPIGRFIRKTSIDEFPQFFNVLKGDMSIVGPRPERTMFVEQFKHEIPGYMKKHLMKAGITGWAQINGLRGDTNLQKRIELDLYYIDNWSPLFDIRIIFLTIFKGFFNKNAY
jgi:putative colanic acid biosysnthesis UDP-glucose lipid carrier transferase